MPLIKHKRLPAETHGIMQRERFFRILVLIMSSGSMAALFTFFIKKLPLLIAIPVLFLVFTLWIAELGRKHGRMVGVGTLLAYLILILLSLYVDYASSIILSLVLLLFPFLWSMEFRGHSFGKTLNLLGIKSEKLLRNAAFGVLVTLFLIYPLIFLEAIAITHLGLEEPGGVARILKGLPIYLAVLSFTLTPFAEEIFFRGFLLDRIGILLSSLLFALAHFSYGSPTELAVAFTAGFTFALMRRSRNSLIPSIAAHALFNLTTVIIVYFVGVPA